MRASECVARAARAYRPASASPPFLSTALLSEAPPLEAGLARRRPEILVWTRSGAMVERRGRARSPHPPGLPQALVGKAAAAGRGFPVRSAYRRCRGDPLRPVPPQYVPRPCRLLFDRSSGTCDCERRLDAQLGQGAGTGGAEVPLHALPA